ncbi:MAG: preprotein translocase subunit SecY [Erysipelotrichaceae bacterium]|nr:preprotein translocase subunit SecY [Erysipelotrichaceae bacterium]
MKAFFSKHKKLILGILFTALAILIWRIGVHIQLPFVEYNLSSSDESIFGFLDIFSGGALQSFSIVALGISPYINASIIIQLLQMDIVPQFKEWAEEGESGKEKLNRWTRYIALLLAFIEGLALIVGYQVSYGYNFFEYVPNTEFTLFTYVYMALIVTAGTAFILWLADQITVHGVGNGASMMIVVGIIASFETMIGSLKTYFLDPATSKFAVDGILTWKNIVFFILVLLLFIAIIIGVVFMEGLQRKIPIQYANRPAQAKLLGAQDSNIPLKLNSASVIPVIFASTLLSFPTTIINFIEQSGKTISEWWTIVFSYQKPIGFAIYVILIFVFSFFYSFMQINPDKIAENLKKQNAYIPGVKPGEATAQYISKVLFKITLLGATYLTVLASLPMLVGLIFTDLPSSVQIGGTSLMIVVGVAVETYKQIKTASQSKEYHGFM